MVRRLTAILACATITGCAGGQPAETEAPTESASASASPAKVLVAVDGTWLGKTSQDRVVELMVEDGAVSSLKVGLSLKLDAVCAKPGSPVATDYRGGEAHVTFVKPVTVTSGRFVVSASVSDVEAQVVGEFAPGSVSGIIDLQATSLSGCSGKDRLKWSAMRHETSP